MRTTVLTLMLLAPAGLVAADEASVPGKLVLAPRGVLMFQEGDDEDSCGCDCGCGSEDGCEGCSSEETKPESSEPATILVPGKPREYKDEVGNFKITFPDSWTVTHEGQPDTPLRLQIRGSRSDNAEVIIIEFWKIESSDASTFKTDTPTDVLNRFDSNGFFQQYFGDGSAGRVTPRVDESVLLGGAEKSGNYEYRSLTIDQMRELRETEDKIRRGDKTAKMPEFKETVVRGRLGLLSPNIYIVRAQFLPGLADEAELVDAYKKVADSFEFLVSGAMPPAYIYPEFNVGNVRLEDTRAMPEAKEARKHTTTFTATGRKSYVLEIDCVIPPGFVLLTDKIKSGHSVILVAQDDHNSWMEIKMYHASSRAAGDHNKVLQDKKVDFESWKSNWSNKARGSKFTPKTKKFGVGQVRGEGWDTIEGSVEGWRGTFTGLISEKSGWRTIIEIETRGKGDTVFADGLKAFEKSLKLSPQK